MTVAPLLSVCIPTLNRGDLIGETLDSLVKQLTTDVEIVIVDGGSSDDTELVVRGYIERFSCIRYVKREAADAAPSNEGFDRDCDAAVEVARGRYCWLMTDDDLFVDGSIAEVLRHAERDPDLIFACTEVRNVDLSHVLLARLPDVAVDTYYDRSQWNAFAGKLGTHLSFVGRVIIRRDIWLRRPKEHYYGSGFIHAAVILSAPLDSVAVVARPLVVIRYGNGLWRPRAFDIWMFQWPALIWSMAGIDDDAKKAITDRFPFKRVRRLLMLRGTGVFSTTAYKKMLSSQPFGYRMAARAIALTPAALANALCSLYLFPIRSRSVAIQLYDLLRCGYASPLTRSLAKFRNVF